MFKNFKTSDKITLYFSLFNIVSLIILVFAINVTYFFIWYNEQKEESLYDMNTNYSELVWNPFINNKVAFTQYILQKDTIIVSSSEEQWLICSPWVSEKVHNNMELVEKLKDSYFYRDGDTIYFIFSRYYQWIGDVKIFFDTTEYIKSQITILKVSLTLIFIWFIISLAWWKLISRFILRNLKYISKKAQAIDVDKKYIPLDIDGPKDDELKILSNALNSSFGKIEKQTNSLKQFITDVSHEFKTPLMIINSDIDLYEKKKEKNKLKEGDDSIFLKSIKNKTAKLNKLIETLFLLTRMEENLSALDFKQTDVGRLTERLINEKLKSYTQKPLELHFEILTNKKISIEESSFNIIIENLISNAIKFSNETLQIDITVTDDYIQVKDYGIWMTTEEAHKVWEKFYRLDTNKEWFGIWLYLVKRMIHMYQWRIELDSKKGEYTSFNIYFNNT